MSLRTFLMRAEVKRLYRDCFPTMPHQPPMPPIVAPPGSGSASAVGTAFDYLLRFYARHLNPDAAVREWISEKAARKLATAGPDPADMDAIRHRISDARRAENDIMASGVIGAEHAAAALRLAPIDSIARTQRFHPDWLVEPSRAEINDILVLARLLRHQDWLVATKTCALNKNFGKASVAIGGADCDVIVDGMIVDVKTTAEGGMRRQDLLQVLGYWALSTMDTSCSPIDTVGVYNARHGVLTSVPIDTLAPEVVRECFLTSFRQLM